MNLEIGLLDSIPGEALSLISFGASVTPSGRSRTAFAPKGEAPASFDVSGGFDGKGWNTTMDKDSFSTLPMDDPGDSDLNAGLWWTDVDYAMRSYVHDCGG